MSWTQASDSAKKYGPLTVLVTPRGPNQNEQARFDMADSHHTEEWRVIKDWPAYEVSDLGRVRRIRRGKGTQATLLKQMIGKRGYPVVGLTMMPRRKKVVVHRLVCLAFHGEPPEGKNCVAHGDGNRTNNRADNLRWASHSDNAQDTKAHGRRPDNRKFSDARVRAIRRARKLGLSYSQLAQRFGVAQMTAHAIVNRRIRADVR